MRARLPWFGSVQSYAVTAEDAIGSRRPQGRATEQSISESPMPRYTIDRFEAQWAVLEDDRGRTFNVPVHWLPADAQEGDVLTVSQQPSSDGHLLAFTLDTYAREERLANAAKRREALPRGPKGDIKL